MSEARDNQRPGAGEPGEEDADVARVVRLAARAPIDAARREAAYRRVHADWRAAIASGATPASAQRRPPWRVALVASVLGALTALGLILRGPPSPPQTVAVAVAVTGSRVALQGGGMVDRWFGRERALTAAATVSVGESLSTAADAAALMRIGAALTVRVAPGSELRFDASDRISLLRGQLYVDSGASDGPSAPLVVSTPYADVRHVGTRYLVRLGPAALEVAVRAGRVRVAAHAAVSSAEADAGEALRVASGSALIERGTVARSGADWAWLERIPAPIVIEGETLQRFLDWYAAETGYEVVLADASDRERLGAIRLRGNVAGLRPDEALDAVAASAGLTVHRMGERVSVDAAGR